MNQLSRSVILVPVSILLMAVVIGCALSTRTQPDLQRFEFASPHMGTLFGITLFASDTNRAAAAVTAAFERVAALEAVMTDYDPESELMRFCAAAHGTPVALSDDLFTVLTRAQSFAEISDGTFDVTVGAYVRLWRFSRKRGELPSEIQRREAGESVGWRKLKLDPRMRTATLLVPGTRLDLGGIGKGFAADEALKVLKGRGITRAIVAASGDIAVGDPPPGRPGWKISIASIDARTNAFGNYLILSNAGVSTSGDTEQFVEIDGVRYSHDLDPRTGLGLTNRVQATVIAPDATTSDALCKPVCVLGPRRGLEFIERQPGVAARILWIENGTIKSAQSGVMKWSDGVME